MENNLKIFDGVVSNNVEDEFEVDFVAMVGKPANEELFLFFNKESRLQFAIQDEERRIVSGVLMVADKPIYRNENGFEFYIKFSKETIFQIALKLAKKGYQMNVNEEHDPTKKVEGCTMFEVFISDEARGVSPLKGFEHISDGSLFASYYIENNEVWGKVKSGEFKGFSVEGLFKLKPAAQETLSIEQAYSMIEKIVTNND